MTDIADIFLFKGSESDLNRPGDPVFERAQMEVIRTPKYKTVGGGHPPTFYYSPQEADEALKRLVHKAGADGVVHYSVISFIEDQINPRTYTNIMPGFIAEGIPVRRRLDR